MHTPCSDTEKPRHMNKGPCCVPRGEGGSPSLLSHCGGRAEPRDGAEGRAGVLQARSPHGPRQHVARTGRTAQGFQHIPCLPHSTRTGHTRGRRSLGRRIRGGRRTQSMRGGAPRGETAQTHRPRGRAAHAAGFRVHFVSGGLPEPSVSSGFCQSHARKMQASERPPAWTGGASAEDPTPPSPGAHISRRGPYV